MKLQLIADGVVLPNQDLTEAALRDLLKKYAKYGITAPVLAAILAGSGCKGETCPTPQVQQKIQQEVQQAKIQDSRHASKDLAKFAGGDNQGFTDTDNPNVQRPGQKIGPGPSGAQKGQVEPGQKLVRAWMPLAPSGAASNLRKPAVWFQDDSKEVKIRFIASHAFNDPGADRQTNFQLVQRFEGQVEKQYGIRLGQRLSVQESGNYWIVTYEKR